MIFDLLHIMDIHAGKKTVTRRLWKRPHVRVGRVYGCRLGKDMFRKNSDRAWIRVLRVYEQKLGDMTEADARAEGHKTLEEFRRVWEEVNGKGAWDPELTVWVIEFEKMEDNYNVMDLFAGLGGASWTGKLIGNWRTVCYVEWDKYCQRIIQQRIKDGIFDDAPIWDDVQTFDGKPWAGSVDIITAGFPCQPFSLAGKRKGESDERNIWPDTVRVISEVRPRYAFLENVPGLITSGYFGRIIGDLSEIGYDCRWTIVSAADVGAPHLRKRLWILAYPKNAKRGTGLQRGKEKEIRTSGVNEFTGSSQESQNRDNDESGRVRWWDIDPADVPDAKCSNGETQQADPMGERQQENELFTRCGERQLITHVGRVADGIPNRNNRLKALGNAWVPAVAATAWNKLHGGPNR